MLSFKAIASWYKSKAPGFRFTIGTRKGLFPTSFSPEIPITQLPRNAFFGRDAILHI